MKILHNHLGYQSLAKKKALLLCSEKDLNTLSAMQFSVIDADLRQIVFQGPLTALGAVAQWRDWLFFEADFSALQQSGKFSLLVDGISPPLMSQPFAIAEAIYDGQHISDLVHYLKSQRCGGMFEAADYARPKLGSAQRVDVHGGWYDASGDASKYLSHLSYANFMNPQQTPQVVWNLLDGYARMPRQSVWLEDRMLDEALHGADFLMRMLDPAGYFYMTVFDRWSKDVEQRDICSYTTQQGHKFDSYQSGYRQGAGSAIAALARASQLQRDGSYTRGAYLTAAERAFAHLEVHNTSYLDDGTENIIDDYCALLAACELFAATAKSVYASAAERRAQNLLSRQSEAGWFWANDEKTRSYFHAAEAGLPYLALMRWMEVAPESAMFTACIHGLQIGLRHEIAISLHASSNPFRYPRQHVAMPGQEGRNQFFIPHQNESGYWWQGENARLGSLASASKLASKHLVADKQLCAELEEYASSCLDWIFGFNPFDACMMQGLGHNNPQYAKGFWNAPGGVCNGITSGQDNEEDIDFRMPEQSEPMHSWRWSEQWIPHGAWLFHALAQQLPSEEP
ncbi:glycoside hydrolase family 9 protein [Undibacterium parvum]|uniref:Endoglucanase-like protein n=2 Tax=Undibacterium TaxID=401469 RepID=A0A6M4A9N3_9BURK|nr:glycoside hydrolase family 9 protein [Undibacterium parvum]AZP12496.1 endoglucanase-like protein [Undibacterium parvum]QJQ06719.1 endoglucanase-like protein [Undibacterium piscinae]